MNVKDYFKKEFNKHKELTRRFLINNAGDISENQIDNELRRQLKAGLIEKVSPGNYKVIPVELSEDQIQVDQATIDKHMNKANKQAKRITKKHKLYVRDTSGILRRLDKLSPELYSEIILLFLRGDGEKVYSILNKGISTKDLKPIPMAIPLKLKVAFEALQKALKNPLKKITVSYNGSYQPLVRMGMI